MKLIVLISFVCFSVLLKADEFGPIYSHFGGEKAEVSSYSIEQPRYGEVRKGYSVMVFVPEEFDRKTRIKIEDKSKPHDALMVFKLNRALYFDTGIYNYSVMTSTFSAMTKLFDRLLFPLKISLSVSEWCGNFYQHLLPDSSGAKRVMHSYFEAEGDKDDFLPSPQGGIYEDNLPILIRELAGAWMGVGEAKSVKMMPALWESRITHKPLAWGNAVIKKHGPTLFQKAKATKWSWKIENRTVTYFVGSDYPHYILGWESSDGSKGTRLATVHTPYWSKHGNGDAKLRKQLKIPVH